MALGPLAQGRQGLVERAAQRGQGIADARRDGRLDPAGSRRVTAIGARPVGNILHRQLQPHVADLRGLLIPECGHIVPLDRPDALLGLL